MAEKERLSKNQFEKLTAREEKIMRMLKEERRIVQQKFPLPYAFLAFFGFVVTWAGMHRIIQQTEWLNNKPVFMVVLGLIILVITDAAYRKLG